MADLCMCGHDDDEHSDEAGCLWPCRCHTYRRSPLSAFRGPSARFTREEAAGWLRAIDWPTDAVATHRPARYAAMLPTMTAAQIAAAARRSAREAGYRRASGYGWRVSTALYIAARILRGVRP